MLDGFKFNPGLLRVFRLVVILLITCHWVSLTPNPNPSPDPIPSPLALALALALTLTLTLTQPQPGGLHVVVRRSYL